MMSQKAAAKFVIAMMHARTDAHLMHLQTRSYAEHVALNGFYDALPDLVDSFVEAYQGKYGIIEDYPEEYRRLDEIEDLVDEIEQMRADLPGDSELQNIVDEIAALVDSTVYKLRYLK